MTARSLKGSDARPSAQQMQRGLGGDDQHRDLVLISAGHAGDEIGGTRAGSGTAHTDLARFTGIAIGHESGSRFMARHYRARPAPPLAARERVIQRFDGAPRDTAYVLDTDLFP